MRPASLLFVLLVVAWVGLCHAEDAPRKQGTPLVEKVTSSVMGKPIVDKVTSVVFAVAKSVLLYQGVSLAWMFSSWVLASLLQPSNGQLGEGWFLPMIQSIIGKPVRSSLRILSRTCSQGFVAGRKET